MSTEPDFIESLDTPEAELVPLPIAPDEAPEPVAETPAEPVAEAAPALPVERPRDPDTGQFLPTKEKDEPRVIPLAAHLEERAKLRSELRELQERLQKLEQPAKAPEPKPDFMDDPKAYIDSTVGETREELTKLKEQAEQLTQEQQLARFTQDLAAREQVFVKDTPDYFDALAHVRMARAEQIMEVYPEATPEQITETIRREELQFAAATLRQGKNPSESVYRMAQKTYGYRPKAQAPANAPQIPNKPAVAKAPVGDPSLTLGSSGGAPADDEAGITPDDLYGELNEAIASRFGSKR
jgi:hypothetical protein